MWLVCGLWESLRPLKDRDRVTASAELRMVEYRTVVATAHIGRLRCGVT